MKHIIIILQISFLFVACQKKKSELKWDKSFPVIGSQSSPRATDLNKDGVLDIVIGAGKNEFQHSDQGILALDGSTGEILWQQEAKDQVYGTPTFLDVNDDGIKDVFIGGRSPNLKALDGKTGASIWEYNYNYQDDPVLKFARYNFYNVMLVPDQNGDGVEDLLTINGGNAEAEPHSTQNRFPGVLMLLNSKTGQILAADTMPDGKESYMAPVTFKQPGNDEQFILFGTGGETISGKLYITTLNDLQQGKLSAAKVLVTAEEHGFIAPPVIADITQDGVYDIIVISHNSKIFAIDGKTHDILWKQEVVDTESSNSFAVGYFNEDDIPDFFTFVSRGVWPENTGSIQIMVDGKTGKIVYTNSIGCTGFSSPVVYDINNDGIDEAIISINEFDCERNIADRSSFNIENKLVAIDFKKKQVSTIDQTTGFKNIFTTPWLGDLDQDGYLDIVHFQYYNYSDILSFLGTRAKRIDLPIKIKDEPKWGSYMGSKGDGVFAIE